MPERHLEGMSSFQLVNKLFDLRAQGVRRFIGMSSAGAVAAADTIFGFSTYNPPEFMSWAKPITDSLGDSLPIAREASAAVAAVSLGLSVVEMIRMSLTFRGMNQVQHELRGREFR